MKEEELLQYLLVPSEQLVLVSPGACRTSDRSGWKLGRMVLTDMRIVFVAADRRLRVQVLLDNLRDITVAKQPFFIAKPPAVRLTWSVTPTNQWVSSRRMAWLIMGKAKAWAEAIYQMALLEVTDQTIERVAASVDPDSAAMLRYVCHQHHAGVDELAGLIDAPCHDDVLVRIHKTINPAAVKLLGCNILVFRRRWRASGDSEPISFNWWIAGRRKSVSTTPIASVNVFEEPDQVHVVADLPGVKDNNDVMLSICDSRLVISAASNTERFNEEAILPPGTRTETMTSGMNNGVLVVRFRRHSRRKTA
ncbi:MAG: Hsp20/alpha crystallin family protein [Phycisphaerae bacterium]|nr:Hsp20/alpha crystallin family protein [Phycisphaerae bacterium]